MTPERLNELAQYNRLGRARGFLALIQVPTVDEMDEVFELAKTKLLREPDPSWSENAEGWVVAPLDWKGAK